MNDNLGNNADAKAVSNNVKSMIDAGTAPLADKAKELHDKGFAAMDKVAAKIDDAQDSAVKVKTQVIASTDAYVQENPWRATLIAGVVGVLAGVIIARK